MEAYFETDDQVKINYRVHRTGKTPLVFLHGWGGNQMSLFSAIDALQGDYTVVTYDHRGFGKSDHPTKGYSVERLAQDTKLLLEHLDLHDAVLVGWSMGGVVATKYLDTYGYDRVSGLALVDVNARVVCDEEYPHGFYNGTYTRDALWEDLCKLATDVRLFAQEMPEKGNMTLYDEAMRSVFIEKVIQQNPEPYILLVMWIRICQQDLIGPFQRLSVPVLFCHGGTSTYCSPEACDYVMGLLQHGTLVEFPECSHFIPIERPAKFAQSIDMFVSEHIRKE